MRHNRQAKYPAQLEDTHAAIEWLQTNPLALPIDSDRIGVWGQSAGGHLAALAALTGARVRAAVTMCGPSDFLSPDWPGADHPVVTDLFGGSIDTHREQMRHASPVTHANAAAPPLLIIHGTRDETVPFTQAERLQHAMQQAGAQSHLVPIADGYHNLRADPRTPGEVPLPEEVGAAVQQFFDRHLRD